MKINIRRTVILLVIFSIGIGLGHLLTIWTSDKTLNNDAVSESINRDTQSTVVNNHLELGKKTKGENIDINMVPNNDVSPVQVISNDSCQFIFNKYKGLKTRHKKRFDSW